MKSLRQTGRTTRMLKAAILHVKSSNFNSKSIIVVANQNHKEHCNKLLKYILGFSYPTFEKFFKFISIFEVKIDDSISIHLSGMGNYKVFYDHFALEGRFKTILNTLHMYDIDYNDTNMELDYKEKFKKEFRKNNEQSKNFSAELGDCFIDNLDISLFKDFFIMSGPNSYKDDDETFIYQADCLMQHFPFYNLSENISLNSVLQEWAKQLVDKFIEHCSGCIIGLYKIEIKQHLDDNRKPCRIDLRFAAPEINPSILELLKL